MKVKQMNKVISDLNHQLLVMKVQIGKMQSTLQGLQQYNQANCEHTNVTHELEEGDHRTTHTCQDCGMTC